MSSKTAPPDSSPALTSKAATPLMQQYLGIKQRFSEEILFFRLGDFYEMFFEDAQKAAPLLEVALTQRQSVPMCGIPHHAATSYISKLIKAGLSVAIAEQLEDPKNTKGMVKRDVVRVITPGTLMEDELLSSKANNFLLSVAGLSARSPGGNESRRWALAAADISTGRQWAGECADDVHLNSLKAQLASFSPSEILVVGADALTMNRIDSVLPLSANAVTRFVPAPPLAKNLTEQAVGAIRALLERDHPEAIKCLQAPEPLVRDGNGTLFLDETAIRHLELVTPADPLRPGPTLLSILDRCVTAMGSRKLRWWILHPLLNIEEIQARQAQVESLFQDSLLRDALRSRLNGAADIERITVRAQAGTVSPRDLEALRNTLANFPDIRRSLSGPVLSPIFASLLEDLIVPENLVQVLNSQLAEEPPAKLADGGVIRDGFHADLDELRRFRRSGKRWIAEMESKEREKTGINSLKVGYNDVFGYYLEVSKTNISKVPPEWIRKQTMANGERYITPELKEQEEKILGAEDKIAELERKLFSDLIQVVSAFAPTLFKIADAAAHIDVVLSMAQVSSEFDYVRPQVSASDDFRITGGRHPVVERQIGKDRFIANDVDLGNKSRRISIITGPNMAGKSTYLRQTALIVVMAQMGCFVPAASAEIGIVDKIFTRIGASDRLSQGQSTFMVEMQEVATLIRNSTPQSLLILDEVGRGTSTYDGVSIAWAVIEHLASLAPRTLFATHYFELTQLEGKLHGVFNAHATAKEWPGPDGRKQVVFLYQILPGAADRSYGIHVAEMAGLPEGCIHRAGEMLKQLESGNHQLARAPLKHMSQLELFSSHPLLEELKRLPVDEMTPLEALNHLSRLKINLNKETA